MVPKPSLQELSERIYTQVSTETGLIAPLESSVIGVICKTIAAEMSNIWDYVDTLSKRASLTTATGADLDSWGILFGVARRRASQATTLGLSRAVRFTNTGSLSVTVPVGLRVFKSSDPQLAYFTTEGLTLSAGQTSEAHVTAAAIGDIYNVAIGELNAHALPNVSLTVTNILPITNGALLESDASYKERILQALRRRNSLNPDNVVALMRDVPGVKDVLLLDLNRGAGTFDIVVVPYSQTDSNSVVSECQTLLNIAVPAGISAIAKPPQYRQLDIRVNLRFDSVTNGREEVVRESIRNQIQSRVDNLPIETGSGRGSFDVADIKAVAELADPIVLSATVTVGLDGLPYASEGEIRLAVGQRLIIRSLSVQ